MGEEDEPTVIDTLKNTGKRDMGILSVVVQSWNLRTRRLRQEDREFKPSLGYIETVS